MERAKSTGERVWWRLFSCRQCEVSEAIRWHYDEAEALGKEDWHALRYYGTTALQYGTLTFHEQLKGTRDADEAIQQLLAFEKGSGTYDDFPTRWKWHCAGAPDTSRRANRCSKHQL